MKPKIVVGVLIIVAALSYLIASSLKENASYYLTVSELSARSDITPQTGVRVHGIVDTGSIQWDAESIVLEFDLLDEFNTLHVIYHGIQPDQLAEAQQVVLEGRRQADGVFQAEKIMLKCPSKYETKGDGESQVRPPK
jgi:cytochrome c-type biogenesis protein CcmE